MTDVAAVRKALRDAIAADAAVPDCWVGWHPRAALVDVVLIGDATEVDQRDAARARYLWFVEVSARSASAGPAAVSALLEAVKRTTHRQRVPIGAAFLSCLVERSTVTTADDGQTHIGQAFIRVALS